MDQNDINHRDDIESIVTRFYQTVLKDPIVGFIFTDIVPIDLVSHIPIIVDFWDDILFGNDGNKKYQGNAFQKHLQLNQLIPLKPGHFTRWLYLFNKAVDSEHAGKNANRIKVRAEMIANSISAAIASGKKNQMNLVLPS